MIEVLIDPLVEQFNPYHDKDGKFTFGPGGGSAKASGPTFDAAYVAKQVEAGNITALDERGQNPSWKVTDPETGQVYHVKEVPDWEARNEVAAQQVADNMSEDLVPKIHDIGVADPGDAEYLPTRMVATEWVEGKQLFQASDDEIRAAVGNMSDGDITRMMATELVLANNDRHMGNVMISDQGAIKLIDNGSALHTDQSWSTRVLGHPAEHATFEMVRMYAGDRPIDKPLLELMTDAEGTRVLQRTMLHAGLHGASHSSASFTRMLEANNIARNPKMQTWNDVFDTYEVPR